MTERKEKRVGAVGGGHRGKPNRPLKKKKIWHKKENDLKNKPERDRTTFK